MSYTCWVFGSMNQHHGEIMLCVCWSGTVYWRHWCEGWTFRNTCVGLVICSIGPIRMWTDWTSVESLFVSLLLRSEFIPGPIVIMQWKPVSVTCTLIFSCCMRSQRQHTLHHWKRSWQMLINMDFQRIFHGVTGFQEATWCFVWKQS